MIPLRATTLTVCGRAGGCATYSEGNSLGVETMKVTVEIDAGEWCRVFGTLPSEVEDDVKGFIESELSRVLNDE